MKGPESVAICVCLYIIFSILAFTAALKVHTVINESTNEQFGPQIEITCSVTWQSGEMHMFHKWIFSGKTLSENSQLVDGDPSRHNLLGDGYTLQLRNVLYADEGSYTCEVGYSQDGSGYFTSNAVGVVNIQIYLPPLNNPKCSLEPGSPFVVGSESNASTLFICAVEETNADITRQLELVNPGGSLTFLSSTSGYTYTLSLASHGAEFRCTMTSLTFPTAERMCSTGPITVTSIHPKATTTVDSTSETINRIITTLHPESVSTQSSTKTSTTITMLTALSLSPTREEPVLDLQTIGIIVGVGGAFLIILTLTLIIVILILRCRKSKNIQSPDDPLPDVSELSEMRGDQPIDNVYSSQAIGGLARYDGDSSSSEDDFPIKVAQTRN